jgi:hypothetical protein
MEVVGTFYDHYVYLTAILYILCPFGTFYDNFPLFGMLSQEKSGNPGLIEAVLAGSIAASRKSRNCFRFFQMSSVF